MAYRIVQKPAWIVIALCAAFAPAQVLTAKKNPVPAAPVPTEIVSARRIFISNIGKGCDPFGEPYFSGGPERAYSQLYAAVKSWNHYKVAGSPSAAQLDFEIGLSCPPVTTARGGAEIHAGTTYDPQLRLTILDLKTHAPLWTITAHVKRAILPGHRDKNFDRAVAALVKDLKDLASGSIPTQTSPITGP